MYFDMIGKIINYQGKQVVIKKVLKACCGKTKFIVEDVKTKQITTISGSLPGVRR